MPDFRSYGERDNKKEIRSFIETLVCSFSYSPYLMKVIGMYNAPKNVIDDLERKGMERLLQEQEMIEAVDCK
jgi:hypothetical protein